MSWGSKRLLPDLQPSPLFITDLSTPKEIPTMIPIPEIARVCHEANRAYCVALGDTSQPPWEDAPQWQRDSAINGVRAHLDGRATSPEKSHNMWLSEKLRDGWTYGEVKDPAQKRHPCCLPYSELSEAQKTKDVLFGFIVRALDLRRDELKSSAARTLEEKIQQLSEEQPFPGVHVKPPRYAK